MSSEQLVIKCATLEDLKLIYQWGDNEGWNPGVHDYKTMFSVNPNGYFVGLLNEIPICCIAIFKYAYGVSFIGWYIVLERYRGKGYGLQMFKHAMTLLKGHNIGLDGVVAQQNNYAKFGFVKLYDNEIYEGMVSNAPSYTLSAEGVEFATLNQVGAGKIANFEYEHTGILRPQWWSTWLKQPDIFTLALVDRQSAVLATINARITSDGAYAISHLYAIQFQYAEAVLAALLKEIISRSSDDKIIRYHMCVNKGNPQIEAFISKFDLKFGLSFGRMWTNNLPKGTNMGNIYLSGAPECG